MDFGDFKFFIRTGNLFSKAWDMCMVYDCVMMDQYKIMKRIMDDSTVIDIGGHIGSFAIYASRKAKNGFVYTFEPYFESFGQLKKNINLNKSRNIIASNKAVFSGMGKKTRLYIEDINYASNSVYSKTNKSVDARCISLSEIFKSYKITKCDFMKMDCEGAEYNILLNTDKEILRKIDRIAMEYHQPDNTDPGKKEDIKTLIKYLEETGFSCEMRKGIFATYPGLLFATKSQ